MLYFTAIDETNERSLWKSDGTSFGTVKVVYSPTIAREQWSGVSGDGIKSIPLNTPPTSVSYPASLEGPTNAGNAYGARYRGYITAPQTGVYTFWIASDNESELWLSTNYSQANKVRIASIGGGRYTLPKQWDKFSAQKSVSISLTEGEDYYIEVLHKEGSSNDNLAVGWRTPSMAVDTAPVVIPGSVLSPFDLPQTPTGLEYTANVLSH